MTELLIIIWLYVWGAILYMTLAKELCPKSHKRIVRHIVLTTLWFAVLPAAAIAALILTLRGK